MVTPTPTMTPEAFIRYAQQHPDTRFDFVDGELVEVSPKPLHGLIQASLAYLLTSYLKAHAVGYVYTEVLHVLEGEKLIPDVSINPQRAGDEAYFTSAPLLAVEIRSDTQSRAAQRRKAERYVELGTSVVWLIMPGESIEVYTAKTNIPAVYDIDATLDGGDDLPGLQLSVKAILQPE